MYAAVRKMTVALAVVEFLASLSLSRQTKANYKSTLRALTDFVGPYLRVDQLTPQHVDGLFASKSEDWRTGGSVNVNYGNLKMFFAWCRDRGYAAQNWNPLAGRKRAPQDETDRIWISDEEFERGLDLAADERDRAVWAWARYMYSRRGELQTVLVRHVNRPDGIVTVRIHKKKITTVLEIGPMWPHLDRWFDWYTENLEARGETLSPHHYLFPSRVPVTLPNARRDGSVYLARSRNRETGDTRDVEMRLRPANPIGEPNKICRDILTRLGYPDDLRLGMHTLRRSGALMDLEEMEEDGEPNPMPIIRERLNHSTDAMTAHYTGKSHDRKRSADYFRAKGQQARTRAATAGENVISLADRRRNTA